LDETAAFKDGRSWGSFDIDGEIGQHAPFGPREGAGDEVESWKSDERITETAETIDEDPFCRRLHDLLLV
jgi:hypothetical protein